MQSGNTRRQNVGADEAVAQQTTASNAPIERFHDHDPEPSENVKSREAKSAEADAAEHQMSEVEASDEP